MLKPITFFLLIGASLFAGTLFAQMDRGGAMDYEDAHRNSLYLEFPMRTWSRDEKDFALGATYRRSISTEKFLGIFASFYGRPYGKSILIEKRPHFFYQVKEYRYIFAAGLDKKFWINHNWDGFISAGLGYSFADHRGAATIDTKDGITPLVNLGLSYKCSRYVFLRFGYQYVNIRTVDGRSEEHTSELQSQR